MHQPAPHNREGLEAIFLPQTCDRLRREDIGDRLDEFVDGLLAVGYPARTIRQYVGPVIHFGAWLARRNGCIAEIDDKLIETFGSHLRRCRCRRRSRVRRCGRSKIVNVAVRAFLDHLRTRGVVRVQSVPAAPKIVDEFSRWMQQHRGSAERTLGDYRRVVIVFVAAWHPRRWRQLDAKAVRSYVVDRRKTTTPARMLMLVRALRMFVRFLVATSRCPSHLERAVPSVPHWRLATLPRYLAADDVDRVLAGCTAATLVGTRDRAVLLLLARLALRAGEVRRLRLVDLDWSGARIRVVGKSRRPSWLPLPQEVGNAILAYLRCRPPCVVPEIFLCAVAPRRGLSATGVGSICQRAIDAVGVASPNKGAHVFRHSAATTLIRHGASLDDVGRLLRHASRESTAIYAKVAFAALRRISQPWPEDVS
jgi:site-specific recombinase XerD